MSVGSYFENHCFRSGNVSFFSPYPQTLTQCLADNRHVNEYWMVPIPAWPSVLAQKAMALRLLQANMSELCDPSDLMRAKRRVTKCSVLETSVHRHEESKRLHRFPHLLLINIEKSTQGKSETVSWLYIAPGNEAIAYPMPPGPRMDLVAGQFSLTVFRQTYPCPCLVHSLY